MIATVWNNGAYKQSGSGYGLKITEKDRDMYFNQEWKCVLLQLGDEKNLVEVNIDKKSFWTKCRELISKEIGVWLIEQGKGSWEKGKPPKVYLENFSENRFRVKLLFI